MAKRKNKNTEQITAEQLDTYFKVRMYQIGITDTSEHCFKVEVDFPGTSYKQPIFSETPAGDIQISYPSLYGGAETIGSTEKEFIRIRYKKENMPEPTRKYFQEPKSGIHIFHPPAIIKKFADKTKIQNLYVVEGEFKAYAGALHGLDIIGIGGKDLFTDGDKLLHPDILAIVNHCDVTNLVLLLDADVKEITWNYDEEPEKDLHKRLNSFCNTVIRFRELTKGLGIVKDAYFAHISERYLAETKGLDDLLHKHVIEGKGYEKKVVEDLLKLTSARIWFETVNISDLSPFKIRGLFRLNLSKGVPSAFYFWYENLIGDREFTFNYARYKKSAKGEGLELVRHEDSFKFMRVGTDYVKIINVPDAKGVLRRRLKGWTAGEITRDYINQGFKNFYETLLKYDEYCNVPCNTEGYQPVVSGCYNMYYQLNHELEPGPYPVITKFIKHVFGEAKLASGYTNYDLAMDYLTILYLFPNQRLPIIALVNRQRNTGKSTFLWLLKVMLQDNCTFIGSEDLKDQFNDDWASKLLIGIDEGFIEKKHVMEKLKSMSTAHSIKLRMMHQGRQEIPFFGKFVLTSNDEDNFVGLDENETRFWVNKVPVLSDDDPKILDKIAEEMPAFLYDLRTRQILHPEKSRHWFAPDLLETEAGRKVKENSKGWVHAELSEILREKFIQYKYPTLYYSITDLSKLLNNAESAFKSRKADITRQLNEKFKLFAQMRRYQFPLEPDPHGAPLLSTVENRVGRVYEFRVENFFTQEELQGELKELFNFTDIITSRVDSPADDTLPF